MSSVVDMLASSGALLDAVPTAIVIHDQDGAPYFANRHARVLLAGDDSDRPVEQLLCAVELYVADTDIRYPLDRIPSTAAWGEVGDSRVQDMEIRRADGTVHLEVWVKPTFAPDGSLGCVVHSFFDASERKNADADLRLSESLAKAFATEPGFADVLETSLHAICKLTGWTFGQAWIPDADGRHLQCAYAWHEEVAGFAEFHEMSRLRKIPPGSGLVGQAWVSKRWEWLDDAHLSSASPGKSGEVAAALPGGHRGSVAMPVLINREAVAVLEFFVLIGGSQDQRSVDRVARLLSQVGLWMSTKRADDEVERNEAQFRKIADSATDAIVTSGSDNQIIYMNPAAERMFGYAAGELRGRSMSRLVRERSDAEGGTGLGRFSEIGRGGLMGPPVHLAAVSKDGVQFPVEMNLTSWQQGNETFLTAIVRDASNRVQAEERLQGQLQAERDEVQRLHVLDELRYTVLQTVAHDLRSPIAAILVLTSVLNAYAEADASAEGFGGHHVPPGASTKVVADIGRSAHKMQRILQDLINSDPLQPLEAGRTRCDVATLVADALRDSDIDKRHPVHLSVEPVNISVDAAQVERIIDNLLSNATKHVPEGVDIWVKVTPLGDGVVIIVEDAGPGVPAAMRKTIFEPFRRGAAPLSPGLGIGLSLVSRFAEVHGGRAWVEDRAGGTGASFRVFLPDKGLVTDNLNVPAIRVVLCDDDADLADVLTTLIGLDAGLHLVAPAAVTGQDAIDAVVQYRPDVVLMDVNLIGDMTGFEAASKIRAVSPSTQVVIMSGSDQADLMRAKAIEVGAASYISKVDAASAVIPAIHSAGTVR